jgi:hypothetical protein
MRAVDHILGHVVTIAQAHLTDPIMHPSD